jgi:hypothetical protein
MKMSMQHWCNDTDRGKPKYWEKSCPSATLSTTNLICTVLRSKPDLHGQTPPTNRLSQGHGQLKAEITLEYIYIFSSYRAVNTLRLIYVKCTYNVTLPRVRITIVAVEKQ